LSSPAITPAKYSFVAPTRALQRARRSSRHTFDGLLLRLLGLAAAPLFCSTVTRALHGQRATIS
tara:strand:+ start:358 stop:549 length:192 start_codon:yes stop_codon:yes gene_type:complete